MSIPNIPNALNFELPDARKRTLFEKCTFIISHITVEPLVLLYTTACVMCILTTQNLHLEKACRVNLHFNASICDAISARNTTNYDEYHEIQVQKLVTKAFAFRAICIGTFAPLLMLFFGSWSDRRARRKPVVLIPLCGETLTHILLAICSHFYLEIPVQVVAACESLPYSLSGTWFCAFLGIFSYVSGLSDENDRTIRIGAVTLCQSLGITVGIFMSGFLIKFLGYEGVYCVSSSMMILAIIYASFVIKDDKIVGNDEKNFFTDFFDVKNVKNSLELCFKKGPNNRKLKMILLMCIQVLIIGPFYGELNVVYMYTRLKFSWNEVDYSVYNTIHFLVQLIGNFTALVVFSKILNLDDAALGIIAATSKLISCFIYAVSPTWHYIYIGAIVEIFYGTNGIALRSLMAKIVAPHELGQSNSLFAVCEALMPLAFGPLYTSLYENTINIYPAAFYIISAFLYIIALGLFVWMFKINKKEQRIRKIMEKNIDQEENLLKKACFNEMKKSMEKLKSTHSLTKC